MNRTTRTAFLAAIILTGAAAAQDEHGGPPNMAQMSFLTGDWREVSDGRTTEEHWVGPIGGVMAGTGISFTDKPDSRTKVEFMTIEVRDGTFAFIARIDGQPPTVFPLKEADNGYALFENPEHDFPQRVLYRIGGENLDQLHARIEGTNDGQSLSVEWNYTKIAE